MKSSPTRRQFITRSAVIGAAAGIGLPKLAMADSVDGISIGAIPQATAHSPTDRVNIASNENPLGPSAAALKAIAEVSPSGGRYGYNLTVELAEEIVKQNGLPGIEYVAIYPGSTAPLDLTVIGFTGPDKSLVTALPSYEQGWRTAAANGAKVHKVMQRKDNSHDVQGMCAVDPNAGILYICNPNNPTGSITTRKDIEYALANKPKGSVLVLDEAYIEFSDTAVNGMDLVAKGEDVIVLRTFSKLYGMAGIRLGYVAARPDLLKKIKTFNIGQIPVTSVVAGLASLRDPSLVPTRRAETKATREDVIAWLNKKGYTTSNTESNCFMVDTKRPVKDFMEAMASHGVMVGRGWDGFPTESRITVGTPLEMARFKEAFALVEAGKRGSFPAMNSRRLASDLRGDYIDGVMLA